MRIFAALDIPPDCLDAIEDWRHPLKRVHPELRWVRIENMHLTLRFLGDVGEGIVREAGRILSVWNPGELEFALDRSGAFYRRDGAPAVYWLSGSFPDSVFRIAESLGDVPDDRGKRARGPFKPHITVARPRGKTSPERLPDPPAMLGRLTGPVLYESRLTNSGARYSVLENFDRGSRPQGRARTMEGDRDGQGQGL